MSRGASANRNCRSMLAVLVMTLAGNMHVHAQSFAPLEKPTPVLEASLRTDVTPIDGAWRYPSLPPGRRADLLLAAMTLD